MDEQTQNKRSSLGRIGTFIFGAARRVLGTAGQHLRQRFAEVREPVAKQDDTSSTPSGGASQPAT